MAKVKGPLFSIDARGQIAKAMVFGGWKGIPWVREWFTPQNPKTSEQDWIRLIFTQGVLRWQGLTAGKQAEWETAAGNTGRTLSGFNFFMSEYINSMVAGQTPSDDPPPHLL